MCSQNYSSEHTHTQRHEHTPTHTPVPRAQAAVTKMFKATKRKFTDFAVDDVMIALKLIKQLEDETSDGADGSCTASSVMLGLESILTTTISDESEWSTAWTKLIRHVMRTKSLPRNFNEAEIELPKKFAYMLGTEIGNGEFREPNVKVEDGEGGDTKSDEKAPAAAADQPPSGSPDFVSEQ